MDKFSLLDVLLNEAGTQVHAIETVNDLDNRAHILRERVAVPTDRLQAFIVVVPEDYTPEERAEYTRMINESLIPVVQDARMEITHARTWEGFNA